MARDHSNTGASSGFDGSWIKLDAKAGEFEVPSGRTKSITGYLEDGAIILEKEQNGKIPARWELIIPFEADFGEGPKRYLVSFSDHWKSPVFSNIVNSFLGMTEHEEWVNNPQERKFRIGVDLKKTSNDMDICIAYCRFIDQKGKDDWMQNKFPWDADKKEWTGVPQSGGTPAGLEEVRQFWTKQAKVLVEKLGGSITALGQSSPGQTSAGSKVDKAKMWLQDNVAKDGSNLEQMMATIGSKMDEVEKKHLAAWVNTQTGWLNGRIVTAQLTFGPTDDLPF